jgi:hypothetical protein
MFALSAWMDAEVIIYCERNIMENVLKRVE